MRRPPVLLAALPAALLACASAPQPAARVAPPAAAAKQASAKAASAGAQQDSMVICEMERPTGSNIAERVCRPATPDEMERLRTQDMMRTLPKAQKRSGP